ncbi:HNH endonuclease signature motif containing protein [Cedecea sp.]|jgi:hypothetical protein|uniref:HNH endonuclease signature motif containing protein n=1 Tax=Cedecea sp. TaxID=1970739 RepID=UPI002F3E75EF
MIEISIEKLKELLSYNPATGVLIWKVDYGRAKAGQEASAKNGAGYKRIGIDGRKYYCHRICWAISYGYWPSKNIDHVDRDRGNNSISNLREVTQGENCRNKGINPLNPHGYKGISLYKRTGKWTAQIKVNGEKMHLGYFPTKEEAAAAYDEAVNSTHGEFGVTNQDLLIGRNSWLRVKSRKSA